MSLIKQFHCILTTYKEPNVLVDDNENAVLGDFGLASITADGELRHASPVASAGSIQWMAPEWLYMCDPNGPDAVSVGVRVTEKFGIHSLATVVVEVNPLP